VRPFKSDEERLEYLFRFYEEMIEEETKAEHRYMQKIASLNFCTPSHFCKKSLRLIFALLLISAKNRFA